MKQTAKTALGGIVAALSLAMMFLGTLLPFLTYALPAAAGVFIVFCVIEMGKKWSLGVFFAVSILSLLIAPDKETAVMYAAFFGYFPIIKPVFESKLPAWLSWICKFAVFNAAVLVAYFMMIRLFGLSFDDMEELGRFAVPILLVMANFAFLMYDIALSKFVEAYFFKWRKHFKKFFS